MTRKQSSDPDELMKDPEWIEQRSPAALRNAEGVARRKNNELARKHPLFAFAGLLPKTTSEEVLENRRAIRADILERWAAHQRREHEQIAALKEEIKAMVSAEEFDDLSAREEGAFARGFNYWYGVREKIRRRKDPMPEETARVLEFMLAWPGEPLTHHELFEAMSATCEFGGKKEELLAVLLWLEARGYVRGCVGRKCSASGIPWAGTWKPTKCRA